MGYESPILVCGIGRSGTSILLRGLCEHPEVVRLEKPGEGPFLTAFINFLYQFEDASDQRKYNLANYRLGEDARKARFAALMAHAQLTRSDRLQFDRGAKHWPVKASFGSEALYRKFKQIFPEGRGLYIIRDGIEVVYSTTHFEGFATLSFAQACKRWSNSVKSLAYLETEAQIATIFHHDLVAKPIETMASALSRIDLSPSDEPGDFISSTFFNSSFSADGSTAENMSDRRTRAWEQWSSEQRSTFLEICAPEMQHCGFKLPEAQ